MEHSNYELLNGFCIFLFACMCGYLFSSFSLCFLFDMLKHWVLKQLNACILTTANQEWIVQWYRSQSSSSSSTFFYQRPLKRSFVLDFPFVRSMCGVRTKHNKLTKWNVANTLSTTHIPKWRLKNIPERCLKKKQYNILHQTLALHS